MEKIFGIAHFAIPPGAQQAFLDQARHIMATAQADLTGTHAYEWFLAADGLFCTVIEAYDGKAGIAHHGRCVGHLIPELLAQADCTLAMLGDVPAKMLQAMGATFGGVDYLGPRFQGRWTEPAPGHAAASPSQHIYAVSHFRIHPGHEDEFRTLAQQCLALVEAKEPDTVGYEWFLDESGTHCTTIDIYRDAAALATHRANVGPVMMRILTLSDCKTELYGALPDAVVQKLGAGLGARFVAPKLQGIL